MFWSSLNFCFDEKVHTKIVLANQRIYGSLNLTNSTGFQFSYIDILAKESFDYRLNFGLWNVLWLKYKESAQVNEVSIMCFGFNSSHVKEAFKIINVHISLS